MASLVVAVVVIGAGGFAYLRSTGSPANAVGASSASASAAASAGLAVSATPRASATPAASASPSPNGGDTRSAGEGPGLVGRPLQAVLGVIGLAGLTVLLTLSYVRLSDRGRRSRPPG